MQPYLNLSNRGVIRICGDVGTGKSSLFNALTEILFGVSPPRLGTREVTETDIVNKAMKRAFGVVGLETGDGYYRIVYCRNWKGAPLVPGPSLQLDEGDGYTGTSLYMEFWDGKTWIQQDSHGRDLRMPKMLDTWGRIQEIMGVDYTTFCNSVYVAQDEALQFIRGRNSDREEIITKLMRLNQYDEAEIKSREEKNKSALEASGFAAAVSTLIQQESTITITIPDCAGLIATSDAAKADINDKIHVAESALQTANARDTSLFNQLSINRQELDTVMRRIHEATSVVDRIRSGIDREKQTALIAISKLPLTTADIDSQNAQLIKWRTIAETENRKLTSMIPGSGKCPACGSYIDDATLNKHKDEQAENVKKALTHISGCESSLRDAKSSLADANSRRKSEIEKECAKRINDIEASIVERMSIIMADEANRQQLETETRKLEENYRHSDCSKLQAILQDLMQKKTVVAARLAEVGSMLRLAEQRQADKDRIVVQRADLECRLAEEKQNNEEWAWLTKNIPKIKQLKFASGSEYLNQRLAHYLGILTNSSTRVILSPFRVKKESQRKPLETRTVEDYIFEFSMTVEDDDKEAVPIQLYSGGERERITLALVSAFHDLATSRGAACNILMLDEVITFLDESSIERVTALVDDLRSHVESVFIIGHDPTLGNLLRPDGVWYAEKHGGMTTIHERS